MQGLLGDRLLKKFTRLLKEYRRRITSQPGESGKDPESKGPPELEEGRQDKSNTQANDPGPISQEKEKQRP